MNTRELVEAASQVFDIESRSVAELKQRLDGGFIQACELLFACKGKVVVTGMGKSGQVGRKIASTLASTGTPALFLHPAETSHGDMGVISQEDVILALSYGGETEELKDLLSFVKRRGVKLISLTGNKNSSLAQTSDFTIDVSVREEACPLRLAPTASTTATLAMGDALAICLMKLRGFKAEEFAEYHPGGSLGRKLLTRVRDIMHGEQTLVLARAETVIKEVVFQMTAKPVRGVAGVIDEKDSLIGIITDGDLRRRLEQGKNPLDDNASDIMKSQPKIVDQNELAEKALHLFERFSIQSLFVVDGKSANPLKPVGILHLQDLLKAGIR